MKEVMFLTVIASLTLSACLPGPLQSPAESSPTTPAAPIEVGLTSTVQTLQPQVMLTLAPSEIAISTTTPIPAWSATPSATLELSCTEYECLQACMERLPEIVGVLDPGTPEDKEAPQQYRPDGSTIPGLYNLAVYAVKGNDIKRTFTPEVPERLKKFQDDTILRGKIWDYFVEIIPESARTDLTNFAVYTDGQDRGSAAEVDFSPPHYFLRVDLFDFYPTSSATSTFIHETGHLMTINTPKFSIWIGISTAP